MIIQKLHLFVLILASSYSASGKTYNNTLTCAEGWVDGSSVNMGDLFDLTKHSIQPIISVLTIKSVFYNNSFQQLSMNVASVI